MARRKEEEFQAFLSALLALSSEATPQRLSARVWTRSHLYRLFDRALAESSNSARFVKWKLTDGLLEAGILDVMQSEVATGGPGAGQLYFLSLAGNREPTSPSDSEILLGLKPDGVVCYSTAIFLHGMSTQVPSHHHVADIVPSSPGAEPKVSNVRSSHGDRSSATRSGLGQLLFQWQGTRFYGNSRSERHLRNYGLVQHSPKAIVRVTTVEQTLYDTLFHPVLCGGGAVVFEAWENVGGDFDEDVFFALLAEARFHPVIRRVGAMLDCVSDAASGDFRHRVRDLCGSLGEHYAPIELIPGAGHGELNQDWQVWVA